MSDYDGSDDPSNVIDFARRTGQTGFTLTPTTTMGPVIPPPPTAPPAPTGEGARTGRRSPLDALAALPTPGLALPPVPAPVPGPQPGHVPATFHNDPNPDTSPGSPGLGALSMAATLAVAIAALRGTHTVLSTWWENRQARHAETAQLREARFKHQLAMQQAGYSLEQAGAKHSAAMQGIRGKGAQQHAKSNRAPSSSEFGRKTLGSRSGSGSGGASGGRGGGAGRNSGSSTGPKKTGDLFGRGGSKGHGKNNASPLGGSRKNKGAGTGGSGVGPKKSPHRGSQGGSKDLLNKQRTKQDGGGRTTLRKALTNDAQKAAARRLERRRKNGNSPALWGNNTPATRKDKGKNNAPQVGAGQTGKGGLGKGGAGNSKGAGKQNAAQAAGRTTLTDALRKDAYRAARKRLKQRRRNGTPPVWGAPKSKKQQQAAGAGANTPKVNLKKPKRAGAAGQHNARKKNRRWWAKARAYAQKKAAGGGWFPGAAPGPGATPGAGQATGNNPGPGAGTYGQRQRRSPYANAAQAAGTTYTATSDHVPGSRAKRWQPDALSTGTPALPSTGPAALNAASTKTFPRPGTTRPKEPIAMPPASAKPDARIVKAKKQAARTGHDVTVAARHMDAQHATEITLDDAIDEYGDFKDDAFKTHDQCARLAARAIKLRDTLIVFAEDLATNHNLIGALFTGAMARLAEAMDLVARMAEEMQTSSLQAAEMAETADNDLNDAYRPYNIATADAGLSTPSAPIHNNT
jgi:hypothetical protein